MGSVLTEERLACQGLCFVDCLCNYLPLCMTHFKVLKWKERVDEENKENVREKEVGGEEEETKEGKGGLEKE